MKKDSLFVRAFLVVAAALLLGTVGTLFIDRNEVPAGAQAQELFALYFEMDQVRQESARIFAELLEAENEPGRVGAAEGIGSKPSLSSPEELAARLRENQVFLEQTLETIDANRFTDPEVDSRYDEVRAFYTALFEFEELALAELSLAEQDETRRAHLATTLFEGASWPALLAQDVQLRDALASLAALHGLEFNPLPYDELFRERLIELGIPLVSEEVNTIVYPFTVSGTGTHFVLLNITFDIPLSDKIKVSLEDPNGKIISTDRLAVSTDSDNSAKLSSSSYIYRSDSVIIVKLFLQDPSVMLIPGDWKMHVTAPVGSSMVIGMIEL